MGTPSIHKDPSIKPAYVVRPRARQGNNIRLSVEAEPEVSMNKADAIDILEHSSSTANLLQLLEVIDHYEDPAHFTDAPLITLDLCFDQNANELEGLSLALPLERTTEQTNCF